MASQMQALVVPINPPAIPGLGTTGGFEFWIQDTGSGTPQQLGDVLNNFLQKARQRPGTYRFDQYLQRQQPTAQN